MIIILKVYLDEKRLQINFVVFVVEAGFKPKILCNLFGPPPSNFLRSYWLVSALHLFVTGHCLEGSYARHYTTNACGECRPTGAEVIFVWAKP